MAQWVGMVACVEVFRFECQCVLRFPFLSNKELFFGIRLEFELRVQKAWDDDPSGWGLEEHSYLAYCRLAKKPWGYSL